MNVLLLGSEIARWAACVAADPCGDNCAYGARPLKRAVQKHLQDQLADKVLAGEILDEATVRDFERNGVLVLTAELVGSDAAKAA